jgi:hypothetical protein
MNTPTPDYGEPWNYYYDLDLALTRNGSAGDERRIAECVNACAGMVDPAEEIQAMREAIREAHKIIQVLYMDALDHHKESWPRANEWMEKYAAFAKP